jgi:phytanoyl-CoA hydroxylase
MTDTQLDPTTLPKHPWNTDFTWVDRTGPFRRLSEDQVAQFDAKGYVVLHDVFGDDVIGPLRDELDAIEARSEEFLRQQADGRIHIAESGAITFTAHLVKSSPEARRFSRNPVFADLCHDLIGPDVRLYWDQAVYKKPEKPRRFPWHQDNGYTYVEPQQYLTCWVALTDATVENGCPQVAPGVHRGGTLQHTFVDPLGWECLSDPAGTEAAPVGAGGIVVFSSLTPHLTGPNTTDAVRKAYILQYAPTGAEMLRGNPADGGPTHRDACDQPDRQFEILRGGEVVTT